MVSRSRAVDALNAIDPREMELAFRAERRKVHRETWAIIKAEFRPMWSGKSLFMCHVTFFGEASVSPDKMVPIVERRQKGLKGKGFGIGRTYFVNMIFERLSNIDWDEDARHPWSKWDMVFVYEGVDPRIGAIL